MTKRPRDSDIQCQLDDITTELKKAKKQARVAQSNVEATESAKDALKARVDKIEQKLETPGLSEQAKAALIAERKKRVASVEYVDKELQVCMEVSQLRSEKLELLKKVEQLLLKEKERLDETPVNDAATAMMARLRELRGRLLTPGGIMDFPGPGLLFDPKATQVYIRDCYKPLFEELVDSTCKDIIITGTPGIGKSSFLYYLLGRLLALPQPPPYILWEHHIKPNKMWRYDCASEEVRMGTRRTFEEQLDDEKSWYICDGLIPDHLVAARVILITSPNKHMMKEMKKSVASVLYMPRWDLEELLACRENVYSNVPKDLAVQLYERYGGVARYVLRVPSQLPGRRLEKLTEELTAALAGCSIDQVTSGIGSLETGPEVSHRVLHIITTYSNDDTNTNKFEMSHLDFASQWVADAWLAKKIEGDLAKLESLVGHSSGPIRGYAFERLMHRLLAKGGTFNIQRINVQPIKSKAWTRSEPDELLLPAASKTKIFKDIDLLAHGESKHIPNNVYFTPQRTNFPTVDAVLRRGESLLLFQMTVSSSGKTLSASVLTDLYERLGVSRLKHTGRYTSLQLFFVVPPDVYHSFKLRADKSSWPPNSEQQPDAARTCVYVLKGGGAS